MVKTFPIKINFKRIIYSICSMRWTVPILELNTCQKIRGTMVIGFYSGFLLMGRSRSPCSSIISVVFIKDLLCIAICQVRILKSLFPPFLLELYKMLIAPIWEGKVAAIMVGELNYFGCDLDSWCFCFLIIYVFISNGYWKSLFVNCCLKNSYR